MKINKLVAILGAVVMLTGCSSVSGDGSKKDDSKANPSPNQTQTQNQNNINGAKQGEVGAIADMVKFNCKENGSKAWNAAWEIKNPDKQEIDYRVVVNVTNAKHQVLATKEISQKVAAGKTQSMKADSVYTNKKSEKGILCFAGVYKKK